MRRGDDDETNYDGGVDDMVKLRVMMKMQTSMLIVFKDDDNHDDGNDYFLLHKLHIYLGDE